MAALLDPLKKNDKVKPKIIKISKRKVFATDSSVSEYAIVVIILAGIYCLLMALAFYMNE